MIIKKINFLFKKTASLLNENPKDVELVLKHYFGFFREFIEDPVTPTVSLEGLGVAYPRKGRVYLNLEYLIRSMRKYPFNNWLKTTFRNLWNFKHQVNEYYIRKKHHGNWRRNPKVFKEWKIKLYKNK